MIEGLYDLMDAVIVGIGRPPKLDLARIAGGASFVGWSRQFLSSQQARTTVQRRLWARARREVLATVASDEPLAQAPVDIADVPSHLDEDLADVAIACFGDRSKGLRSCGRAHLTAHTLATAFQLPRLDRAVDLPGRAAMLAQVEADPHLVHEVLRFLVEDLSVDERCVLDEDPSWWELATDLACLFSTWTDPEIHLLLELPLLVAQALVIAALTPVPPPQARHVSELRRKLVASGTPLAEARAIVQSFTTLVGETTTSEFNARRELELKDSEQRCAERDRFDAVVEQILSKGWTQLGATPGEVEVHLHSMLDQIRYGELVAAA
jgi:hypothetical protein